VYGGSAGAIESDRVVREGYILKGHPELKADTWYVVHHQKGQDAYATELAFDENSICGNGSVSGKCRPDLFVNEREAHVEGSWQGKALLVSELTFTKSLR